MTIPVRILATDENYTEAGYLGANPDLAHAVKVGAVSNVREHFDVFGKAEGRKVTNPVLDAERTAKLRRLEPHLRTDMPHVRRGLKLDFLSEELRQASAIEETTNVSAHGYGSEVRDLVSEFPDGLILDCGAGQREDYLPNVVNYEIVDYDSTDVLGVGEELPFKDDTFDGVISIAVLEHVRDPFRCAAEIARVLKPGGKLVCSVPLLAPYHGYPHHYFNMTEQGARALFENTLLIDDHLVVEATGPVWSLSAILHLWAHSLSDATREQFERTTVAELLRPPQELARRPWVTELPTRTNFALCMGTVMLAHKPKSGESPRTYPALWGSS